MEDKKHEILKKVNDADSKHKQLKEEVLVLLDELKIIEDSINNKLTEIDSVEKEYVDLMAKLME